MRKQRIAMVQTVDQYMLCHRAVKELFLEQLRLVSFLYRSYCKYAATSVVNPKDFF
jgi:Protein-tyrosine phosphatase